MKNNKKLTKEINDKNYKIGCADKLIKDCKELAKIIDDEKSKKSCEKWEKQCKDMKREIDLRK